MGEKTRRLIKWIGGAASVIALLLLVLNFIVATLLKADVDFLVIGWGLFLVGGPLYAVACYEEVNDDYDDY